MMIAYNLRRLLNIIGLGNFMQYLEGSIALFLIKIALLKPILSHLTKLEQEIKNMVKNLTDELIMEKPNKIIISQRSF